MRHKFFVIHNRRVLYARSQRGLSRRLGQGWLANHSLEIGIHDDLSVVAQVDRIEFCELLPPGLHMRYIDFVALQVIT